MGKKIPMQGFRSCGPLQCGTFLLVFILVAMSLINFQDGYQGEVMHLFPLRQSKVRTVHTSQEQQNWEKIFLQPRNGSHIIVYGGSLPQIGNKMFILASMLGIAYKSNMTLQLTNHFDPLKDIFKLSITRRLSIVKLIAQLNAIEVNLHSFPWCSDKTDNLWHLHRNVSVIRGYLQCLSNFEDIQSFLHSELDFIDHLKHDINAYLKNIMPQKWITRSQFVQVGIHVRRGDFLRQRNVKMGFTVAPKEYFSHAMDFFNQRYGNVQYFVASDDLSWCKVNLNATNIIFSSLKTPAEDLAALVHVDHIIISTGTFSWWAGFLNHGTVIYYKQYPKPGSHFDQGFNSSRYFPPQWIGML